MTSPTESEDEKLENPGLGEAAIPSTATDANGTQRAVSMTHQLEEMENLFAEVEAASERSALMAQQLAEMEHLLAKVEASISRTPTEANGTERPGLFAQQLADMENLFAEVDELIERMENPPWWEFLVIIGLGIFHELRMLGLLLIRALLGRRRQ